MLPSPISEACLPLIAVPPLSGPRLKVEDEKSPCRSELRIGSAFLEPSAARV